MKLMHFMTGALSVNTYVAYDEVNKKGFIVDPGGYSSKITKMINDEGIEIEYIILTHGHADHIGGVKDFKRDFPEAKLVAYSIEEEMLKDAEINSTIEILGYPLTLDADIYVNDLDSLKVGDLDLTFIHTPGHTKGSMSIQMGDVIFTGDTLFKCSIGRTDFYGGSFKEIIRSIKEKLFTYPDNTICLPGHMDMTTIGNEKKGNPFV